MTDNHDYKTDDYNFMKFMLDKAKDNNERDFVININGFDGIPDYRHHISSFAAENNLDYVDAGFEFRFHIRQ